MDHKPLLQERPPAYNLEAGQGDYACGAPGYGAIPSAPPPPPYPYLVTGIPTPHPRVYSIHGRTVTRYPANSIVVVGGCPVCRSARFRVSPWTELDLSGLEIKRLLETHWVSCLLSQEGSLEV
ncbi:brain protein I3 isoform X2 [Octodon degus]|uniref:Membrane protein BRI3 n=1 Tax=Octodon degus TaxID=10160 RepID=A0A6P6E9Z4_OCTDE|nr:brain protein I3 isoform X2 [Octodon degus]